MFSSSVLRRVFKGRRTRGDLFINGLRGWFIHFKFYFYFLYLKMQVEVELSHIKCSLNLQTSSRTGWLRGLKVCSLRNSDTKAPTGYGCPQEPVPMPALPVSGRGDGTVALWQVSLDTHCAGLSLVATTTAAAQGGKPVTWCVRVTLSSSVVVVDAVAVGIGAWKEHWQEDASEEWRRKLHVE